MVGYGPRLMISKTAPVPAAAVPAGGLVPITLPFGTVVLC
jgi:hypothetical protein